MSFDGNDLRKEKRSGEFQCCEGHNSEMKHFRTYVVMNCFDCLHVGNTYLKLCRVFLKHSVYLILLLEYIFHMNRNESVKFTFFFNKVWLAHSHEFSYHNSASIYVTLYQCVKFQTSSFNG